MNKLRFFFLSMVFLSLIFSSCKKDEYKEPELEPLTLQCNAFESNNNNKITRLEDRGDGVDYIVTCQASVQIDLTIDPGVTIAFQTDAGLEIQTSGSINAVGTSDKKIVFTGVDKVKGSWSGILNRSNDVKNVFTHTVVEFAGGTAFNSNNNRGNFILWSNSYIRINNSSITDGAEDGINADYQDYDVEINNCNITRCNFPMYVNANIAHKISGGSFTGNTTDAIRLRSDRGGRLIGTPQTWANLGVPYRIASTSDQLVISGGTLTIQPGVTVAFESGQGIRVGETDASALIASGTASNPITFTGVDKVAGSWNRVEFRFTNSPLNEISNAIIEYAGASGAEGAIYMWAEPTLKVNNVQFKNINACAFFAAPVTTSAPNTNLTQSDNTVQNVSGGLVCP